MHNYPTERHMTAENTDLLPPIFRRGTELMVSGLPGFDNGTRLLVTEVRGPWVSFSGTWVNVLLVPASWTVASSNMEQR